MKRIGKAKLSLTVWGDWYTIIGARDYRDVLLPQKPHDDDVAEWGQYTISCSSDDMLVNTYAVFRKLRLQCAITMQYESDDKAVKVYAISNAYGQDGPVVSVDVKLDENKICNAIATAVDILEEVTR